MTDRETQRDLRYFGVGVIVRDGRRGLFQRKTPGYPIESYVGRLTLIGGFWSTVDDVNPRQTMVREAHEEIRPHSVARAVEEQLEFLYGFDFRLTELDDGDGAFLTRTYVFDADVGPCLDDSDVRLLEGEAAPVEDILDLDAAPIWGHDRTLRRWADDRGLDPEGVPRDASVDATLVTRREPASYRDLDLQRLRSNPLRDSLGPTRLDIVD